MGSNQQIYLVDIQATVSVLRPANLHILPRLVVLRLLVDLKLSQPLEINTIMFNAPPRHRRRVSFPHLNRTVSLEDEIAATRNSLAQVLEAVLYVDPPLESIRVH